MASLVEETKNFPTLIRIFLCC